MNTLFLRRNFHTYKTKAQYNNYTTYLSDSLRQKFKKLEYKNGAQYLADLQRINEEKFPLKTSKFYPEPTLHDNREIKEELVPAL